jgi:serine protease Do
MAYYNPRLIGGPLDSGALPRKGLATFLAALLLLSLLALAVGFAVLGTDPVERVRRATVWIRVDGTNEGTGVIISPDGYILTAAHVVKDGQAGLIEVVLNSGLKNAETVHGQVTEHVGKRGRPLPEEMGKDYALLKIEAGRKLPHLPVIASDGVKEGSKCIVAGYPLGSEMQTSIYGPNIRIDPGHITAIMRGGEEGPQAFNTDVTIREGMSGGPCTDDRAQVIGLNMMYSEQAAANLILPTSRFKHVWESIAQKR